MKNRNLILFFGISCFLFSSLYAQAVPQVPAPAPNISNAPNLTKPPHPRNIRHGITISGIEGSFKCDEVFIDDRMLPECKETCRRRHSREQQREACVYGCYESRDTLLWLTN